MLPAATVDEISKLESGAWYTPLPGFEFSLCQGVDSARFLQGQLSCNLQKLTPVYSLRGALCNLKGRVITDLRVLLDNNGILLLSQYGMREKMMATLNKYRVFFKTTLEPVDGRLLAVGVGGSDWVSIATSMGIPLPVVPDEVVEHSGLRIIALPSSKLNPFPRFLCIADSADSAATEIMQAVMARLDVVTNALWRLADIRDGDAHIRPEQTELFTPQLLNYDINGVIDFKKGCYTGQEIVARMHYKAEAKRRLYHSTVTSVDDQADILDQVLLPDGSVESLIILNVHDASNRPDVTDLIIQNTDSSSA